MSREKILQTIRQNKPSSTVIPPSTLPKTSIQDLPTVFTSHAQAAKSRVVPRSDIASMETWIQQRYDNVDRIVSTWSDYPGNVSLSEIERPIDLRDVDLAIITSPLGVAENGAVWVSEKEIQFRILPFIAQHLIVVLSENHLVVNMQEAYQKINLADSGFGVFISGPSKTADIEQSLVVGAQGSRSHTILLVEHLPKT